MMAKVEELRTALGHLWSLTGGNVPDDSLLGREVRSALQRTTDEAPDT